MPDIRSSPGPREVCQGSSAGSPRRLDWQRDEYADCESLQADPERTPPQDEGDRPRMYRERLFDRAEPLQPPTDLSHPLADPVSPGERQGGVLIVARVDPA